MPPVLVVVDQLVARRDRAREALRVRAEAERWRGPAFDAFETYLSCVESLTTRIKRPLLDSAHVHGRAATRDGLAEELRHLVAQEPDWIARLEAVLVDAEASIGAVAVGTLSALALYEPLAHLSKLVFRQQRLLRKLAGRCRTIHYLHPTHSGQEHAAELAELVFSWGDHAFQLERALRRAGDLARD